MFRLKIISSVIVLAIIAGLSTSVSAQSFHGHGYIHHNNYHHSHVHRFDPHRNHYGHQDFHGYNHLEYMSTAPSYPQAIPVYAEGTCPSGYGNGSNCSNSLGCPLGRDQVLPYEQQPNSYQNDFNLAAPGSHHENDGHNHSGHSHDGNSHEGHSHGPQDRGGSLVPLDQNFVTPERSPSTPRTAPSPRPSYLNEQPRGDESIRMNNPPPATTGPQSPSPSGNSNLINTPPPPTL